jgi:peptidoglycan/LPS O-acetylase OafA/YrhL
VHPVAFLAAGIVGMELVHTEIPIVNATLWFGLFFFAGATMSRWLDWWLQRGPTVPALLFIAASAWAAYTATVNGYTPTMHWRPLLFSVLGVVGLVWFASRMRRVLWLEWVGQRSIVFYVTHVPFIWLVTLASAATFPRPLTSALVVVGTGAGCLLLARYSNRSLLFEFPRRNLRTREPEPAVELDSAR